MEQHAIRVFDLQSFDEVAHWPLLDGEECLCLTAAAHPAWSASSNKDSTTTSGSGMGVDSSSSAVGAPEGECIVVGTAFSADDQEYEPSAGRLLVLSLTLHKSGAGGFGGLSSSGASSPVRTSPSSRGGSFSPSGGGGASGGSGGLAGGASLDVLCERAIKGAVYDVSPLGHSTLACGVGPKVLREEKICSGF